MKKCKCCLGCKILKKLLKLFVILNVTLFTVFFFDLDGKLLFYFVEPFLKRHYDTMDRKDTLKTPYKVDEFPRYSYDA